MIENFLVLQRNSVKLHQIQSTLFLLFIYFKAIDLFFHYMIVIKLMKKIIIKQMNQFNYLIIVFFYHQKNSLVVFCKNSNILTVIILTADIGEQIPLHVTVLLHDHIIDLTILLQKLFLDR